MNNYTKALEKIKELVEEFGKGGYIFRGTTECYSKEEGEGGILDGINSNLYRWVVKDKKKGEIAKEQETLRKIFAENEAFSPSHIEREIVENAKRMFPSKTEAHEILTELQHFGGKTNMIDFSRNMYVALFFACQGEFEFPGELIALHEEKLKRVDKIDYDKHQEKKVLEIIDPAATQSSRQRVHFQSSIFVRPANGYININPEFCKITPIPADYKKPLLEYLRTFHNITEHTVYNDLHGFIKNEKNNETASIYFYIGYANQEKGDYESSIVYYGKHIEINPNSPSAYNNRGTAYGALERYALAIMDYDKSIALDPNYYLPYNNRGYAYYKQGDLERAIIDLNKSISINPNYSKAFYNRGAVREAMGDKKGAEADYAEGKRLRLLSSPNQK